MADETHDKAAAAPPGKEPAPAAANAAPEEAAPTAANGAPEEAAPAAAPHPLVTALSGQFAGRFSAEGADAGGNPIVRVGADAMSDVLLWLRDSETTDFRYLADLTVIDWTERSPRFDVVYHLYSIAKNHYLTVKVGCADGEGVPSVAEIWGTANWQEREAYDLYGVEFLGHPELERIFLPEDWEGFPLRKDYPLEGPNLDLLVRQQAAFRGGRFDRIRGDYDISEKERELTTTTVVGPLWTPRAGAGDKGSGES